MERQKKFPFGVLEGQVHSAFRLLTPIVVTLHPCEASNLRNIIHPQPTNLMPQQPLDIAPGLYKSAIDSDAFCLEAPYLAN